MKKVSNFLKNHAAPKTELRLNPGGLVPESRLLRRQRADRSG